MKQVSSPAEVPKGQHFVVIEYEEISVYDGWEQERGGPDTTRVAKHYVTLDRKVWEQYIAELEEPRGYSHSRRANYVAFEVKGLAKVERKVTVNVGVS